MLRVCARWLWLGCSHALAPHGIDFGRKGSRISLDKTIGRVAARGSRPASVTASAPPAPGPTGTTPAAAAAGGPDGGSSSRWSFSARGRGTLSRSARSAAEGAVGSSD